MSDYTDQSINFPIPIQYTNDTQNDNIKDIDHNNNLIYQVK